MVEFAGDEAVGDDTEAVEVVAGVDLLVLLVNTGVEEVIGIVTELVDLREGVVVRAAAVEELTGAAEDETMLETPKDEVF